MPDPERIVPCQLAPNLNCYSWCKSRKEIEESLESVAQEDGRTYDELVAHIRASQQRMDVMKSRASYILKREGRVRDCTRYPEVRPT